ncbi:MAG: hypothetical protein ACFE91_15360 [Promethearchaeota archaeon]
MEQDKKEFNWTFKLDWLNILSMLNLESISQIPESKKEKALKRISKFYSIEALLEYEPSYLDRLVVNELKELMKRELQDIEKKQERIEKNLRNKIIPMKSGGIIRFDPNDLPKEFRDNPEELIKHLKKFLGQDDDEDDDSDSYKEDNTGYYI